MKKTNYDYIARVEKEISKKFGKDTIKNPHAGWDEDKEEKYIEDCKIFQRKIDKNRESDDMIEHNGFLISKKLITVNANRTCPVCETYSFNKRDDFYMNKFECCYDCFIQWVDGREERWLAGWRPNQKEKT